jgi:serine O-acetyltransferase
MSLTSNKIADLNIKSDISLPNEASLYHVNQRKGQQLFIEQLIQNNCKRLKYFPDKQTAEAFIESLFEFLFVGQADCGCDSNTLTIRLNQLKSTFAALLFEVIKKEDAVKAHADVFFNALPRIYDRLLQDAEAIVKSDPAAQSIEEVLAAYPGFFATVIYRLSNQMWKQGISILPRFFSEYAHSKTGIDIHPAAEIGESFSIDHGTGIVIGETVIIGNNVKIYQGVTLGALNVSKENASTKRHPTIEDGVIIYSGATILGGKTIIGAGSIIGGNVWLTYSVPTNSVVYHKSEVKVKDKEPFLEPLNFVI